MPRPSSIRGSSTLVSTAAAARRSDFVACATTDGRARSSRTRSIRALILTGVSALLAASCGDVDGPAKWAFGVSGAGMRTAEAAFDPTRASRHSQPANLSPADARSKEYKVKAALLYNFLKYARFPKGTFPKKDAPVTILVVGKNPFGPILEKVLGKKKAGGRPFKFEYSASIPKGEINAQLVFAAGLDEKRQKQLIEKVSKKPALLVGEMDGFAERGGFINLYLEDGKVRFAINTDRQKSTGIQLKAELLKLAKLVESKKDTSGGGQ